MELNTIEWNGIDFHEMEMRNIELNRMEGNCIKWNSFIHSFIWKIYIAPLMKSTQRRFHMSNHGEKDQFKQLVEQRHVALW